MHLHKVENLQQHGRFPGKMLLVFYIAEISNLCKSLRFMDWILSQRQTQEIVTKTGS